MRTLACLDGELMPVAQAKVPVWDRGFLFGDAVYEVLRLYDGRGWLEREHMARLERSLKAMLFPPVDLERLAGRVTETVKASGIREGTVYIHLTRGVAPRLHTFPNPPIAPTELIIVSPYDDATTARLRETGVAVLSQRDLRWGRCDVKSTNLLPNVLANEAAHRGECYEAVLVGDDGLVTEATHSSLLWVREGKIEGTPEGPGILPGVTRLLLGRLVSAAGIPFEESRVTLAELSGCDEILLLGTTIEVLPVVTIDGVPVGGGCPGPLTRRLQHAYRTAVEHWLEN